jgi:alpha-beta hydrolase superfamily lysophospholipase
MTAPAPPPRSSAARELASLAATALASVAAWALFASLGPVPFPAPQEPRVAVVIAAQASIAWLGLVAPRASHAPDARARAHTIGWRFVWLVLPLACLIAPRTALVVDACAGWLVSTWHWLIGRTIVVTVRDATRAWWARGGAVLLVSVMLVPSMMGATWGIVSSLLRGGVSRIVHAGVRPDPGEREVRVHVEDGVELGATLRLPDASEPATGVLLVHGYADGRRRMAPWARLLAAHGFASLRVTLRAHGDSGGTIVSFADRERHDVVAAARALQAEDGVRAGCVVAIGNSMGGGALIAAAPELARAGTGAVIAFGPPTDYHTLIGNSLPPAPIRTHAAARLAAISHALGAPSPLELVPREALADARALPVLVFHSPDDRTVPIAQSHALVEAHPEVHLVTLAPVSHGATPEEVAAHHLDTVLDALRAGCP